MAESKKQAAESSVEKLAKHVIICTPVYNIVPADSFVSFVNAIAAAQGMFEKPEFIAVTNTIVSIARANIAKEALEKDKSDKVDYLLWIDSDSVFTNQDIAKLFITERQLGGDMVSGVYVMKKPPHHAILYKEVNGEYRQAPWVPKQGVIDVDAAGFGFLLMKMEVLRKLAAKHGVEKIFAVADPDTGKQLGEDLVFCKLAKREGFKITANPDIKIGHAGSVVMPDVIYK